MLSVSLLHVPFTSSAVRWPARHSPPSPEPPPFRTIRLTRGPRRKLNKSPSTVEDQDVLKKPLTTPLVRKIDLHFPLGLEVTARNLKGVTIKDALDAIYKQFKKKVRRALVIQPRPPASSYQWVGHDQLVPESLLLMPRSKQPTDFSMQADDEIGDSPFLAGFEWDPEECYTRFIVHQKKEGGPAPSKKKKKGGDE